MGVDGYSVKLEMNLISQTKEENSLSMPLILVFVKQKQVDLCEFKANLVYRVSSRTEDRATEKSCLEKPKKKKTKKTPQNRKQTPQTQKQTSRQPPTSRKPNQLNNKQTNKQPNLSLPILLLHPSSHLHTRRMKKEREKEKSEQRLDSWKE
jgi:hypothetical protein